MSESRRTIRKFLYAFLVIGIFVAGLAYTVSLAEVLTVRANGPLHVARNPVLPYEGENLVSKLRAGEKAEVVACEDIKTDYVILVRVQSGETAYVRGGDFSLIRERITFDLLLSAPGRITFSCSWLFRNGTAA